MTSPRISVVILAAGDSSRLIPITRDFPKCLLHVGARTVLEHQLSSFKAHGVDRFIVIGGYRREKLEPFIEKANAKLIANEMYDKTDSLYSLWLSKGSYDSDIIIINSDVYMDAKSAHLVVNASSWNSALVNRAAQWDPESTKVRIQDGKIRLWSRALTKEDSSAENIGVVRILQDQVAEFYETVDRLIRNRGQDLWWPEALNFFVKKNDILPVDCAGMICKEIDTSEDYTELLKALQSQA